MTTTTTPGAFTEQARASYARNLDVLAERLQAVAADINRVGQPVAAGLTLTAGRYTEAAVRVLDAVSEALTAAKLHELVQAAFLADASDAADKGHITIQTPAPAGPED